MSIQPNFAQDPDELFDVIAQDGSPTGIVKPRADVHRDGDWHRAIHVWVYGVVGGNSFVLFNQRGRHKDTFPGLLDVTVGGHLTVGEDINQAFREIDEEIGVIVETDRMRFFESRHALGEVEREIQEVFLYRDDRPLETYRPNPAELEGLVSISVSDAIAIFEQRVPHVEAVVLSAADRRVRPFTVTRDQLLPDRHFEYYHRVALAIEQALRS